MAPKKNARDRTATPTAAPTITAQETASTSSPGPASSSTVKSPANKGNRANWDDVLMNIYQYYTKETPQRTKLIDVFLSFLVLVGGLQFLYCVLAGNYPFNAFLSGFCATVGQFVLTVSLRIQTTAANKSDFPSVSPERAFADFVVCSLILHFFCVNFIN
ncbi:Dolichyl-diphosphooligosaccharide-protein glycosyltransferase subunit dad1 [Conoideocrella luteorostrata]|uniref:Dolichyl-diphosphooligosaccharide--protein glycosyltransferase subunit OST2 n=1 Tax=Conoideocrella luteorostrata TaxID=1105319 RepID=A0AAJ0CZW5_9HYPO|nr:Dolichyl-diphosphooligosaccharide-protein glycosyltransferase subunit dad1 [Conoideocrella luteorostrata]